MQAILEEYQNRINSIFPRISHICPIYVHVFSRSFPYLSTYFPLVFIGYVGYVGYVGRFLGEDLERSDTKSTQAETEVRKMMLCIYINCIIYLRAAAPAADPGRIGKEAN